MKLTHREVWMLWSAFRTLPTKNGDLAVALETETALKKHADAIASEDEPKPVGLISEIETVEIMAEKATWRHMRKLYDEFGEKNGWPSWAIHAAYSVGPKLAEAAASEKNGKE